VSSLSSWSLIRLRLWSTAGSVPWLCAVLLRLCHSAVTRLCDAVLDPGLDVAPSKANMPSDAESWWALAVVSPCVDRSHWHAEVFGEIFNGEQSVEGFHCPNLAPEPSHQNVIRVSVTLSTRIRATPRASVRRRQPGLAALTAEATKALVAYGFSRCQRCR